MSVTQLPRFQLPSRSRSRTTLGDAELQELEVEVQADRVTFKHVQENSNAQLIALWLSAIVFMLFVVSVIPLMHLTVFGNFMAVLVGLVALATVGIIVQARIRATTIELSPSGIRIDHGTPLDREVSEIRWADLATVELEPVDAKNERKGMHLEFKPREGEPVRALPGIGVGDLNVVRQAVITARRGSNHNA